MVHIGDHIQCASPGPLPDKPSEKRLLPLLLFSSVLVMSFAKLPEASQQTDVYDISLLSAKDPFNRCHHVSAPPMIVAGRDDSFGPWEGKTTNQFFLFKGDVLSTVWKIALKSEAVWSRDARDLLAHAAERPRQTSKLCQSSSRRDASKSCTLTAFQITSFNTSWT